MHEIMTNAWFGLMCLMLAFYVITDGFDLGVGILSLFTRDESDRDQIFLSIGHVWDANETWLVVLGGALFGAFPLAYATLMEQLYIPVMALIGCLIMRGAAIEFRHAATTSRRGWDVVFGIGSLGAAACQGVILGQVITGLEPGIISAGFAAIAASGVIAGYALLGSTYLIKKTSGKLVRASRRHAVISLLLCFGTATILTFATMQFSEIGRARWLERGVFPLLVALAMMAVFAGVYVLYSLHIGSERGPFRGAIGLFLASFLGLGASIFPNVVPGKLSLAQAASDSATMAFMLCGIAVIFPIMIGYNIYQYYVFRGRVELGH